MIVVDRRDAESLKARAMARVFAFKQASLAMPGMPVDVAAEVAHCRADFRYFLRYWHFKNPRDR